MYKPTRFLFVPVFFFAARSHRALRSTRKAGRLWLLAGALACGPLQAQQVAPAPGAGGLSLHWGRNSDYDRTALMYETSPWWRHRFENGWGRLELNGEFGVSYWRSWRHGSEHNMWQANATPVLRWWPVDTFYLEAGVGATVLSRTEFSGHDLSTAFQFGSHAGLGILINRAHRLGVRYSHFSNADIKKPNPGLDLLELTYTYQF